MKRLSAALVAALLVAITLAPAAHAGPSEYGIESINASASTNQAGAHPDFTVAFKLKTEEPSGLLPSPTRDVAIGLPPGLLANPNAVPRCSAAQLVTTDVTDPTNSTGCPQDTQIGITEVELFNAGGLNSFTEPVYNMASPGGDTVARFGFIADVYPVFVNVRLRSEGDFGATATVEGAGSLIPLLSAVTTIWGVPAAESHNAQRITPYEAAPAPCGGTPCTSPGGLGRPSGLTPTPFTINPTRCGVPRQVKITATSYAQPSLPASASTSLPQVTGCGALGFEPKLTVTPTDREAAEPTGLDADLTIPQDETVGGFATSQLRYARVTLPKGMTIAAGAADGLEACSDQQAGYGTAEFSHCPEAAKIGTAEIDSPALPRVIDGAVYQRTPVKGNLFGIWLITDELGVHLKLPGVVHADAGNGRLTTTFEGTPATEGIPQAPVREFRLHFFSGPRAPLANPQTCGTYLTEYEFAPWSGRPPVRANAPMTIDRGCGTGGFDPRLSTWSQSPIAGAFSPFFAELVRQTGDQNVLRLDATLPPGVLAKLSGVPRCEGAAAETGACPAGSRVGATAVATGPGSSPLWIPQPGKEATSIFLSGPYQGAPFGLVIRTPAQAGPFDLGTVVTRAAIRIDPETARVTVASDPLPQFLEGVPVSYRTIYVDSDRPKFTLNPTSCDKLAARARVVSSDGSVAEPSSRFQVGECERLGFKPRVSLSLDGKTDRGGHPRLAFALEPRKGDANIATAQVSLPHSEFLDQAHIRTVCTRVQFAASHCPKRSIYGRASATTPLLEKSLRGPVYLRSSNHLLPDLVVAFHGQVDFNLVGRIDSIHGGIRTTVEAAPDVPVSGFRLEMNGGHMGLLVNSTNLCAQVNRAAVKFTSQSHRAVDYHPVLRDDCGGKGPGGHKHGRGSHREKTT